MSRALRKAGWALAAAGGIGIAVPAGAQQPEVVRVLGPGGHVMQAGEVVMMTEGQARQEEAQVELALLADPMLFSYGLGAHVQGATVEVRGFVPTEVAHEQALKVAREQTPLSVIDRLQVHPTLATRCSVDKPENIQRAAKALLEDAFPDQGRGMDVRCDARGRVTVTGTVASAEDRVQVSRKLRQVYGCSCVANQLTVGAARPEARPAAATTAATVLPGAPPTPARPAVRKWEPTAPPPVPVRPVMTPVRKESEPPSLGMPRVYSGEPMTLPPAPVVKPLPEPPPAPKRPAPPPAPPIELVFPSAKPEARTPAPVPGIDADRPYGSGGPSKVLPPAPPPVTIVAAPTGPAVMSAKVPPPAPPMTPVASSASSTVEAPKVTPALPPVTTPKPAPAVKLPQVVTEPSAPAPKPAPLPTLPPVAKAPAVERHNLGGSEESYVAEGTITLDDDPVPVSSGPKVLSGAPTKPAEGTLTLTPPPMPPSKPASAALALSAPPVRPPAPPAPPRPTVPPAVRLKERVQAICGPAYEVQVIAKDKESLQLNLTGRSQADGKRLMERITPVLKSPEFSAFEINVDIVMPDR